jgi:hypothetical protein
MSGVTFSYKKWGRENSLFIRLDPYEVSWTYSLNTNVQNTYAGQVIQILSAKIDTLTIKGKLGLEGPWGRQLQAAGYTDRQGFTLPQTGYAPTPPEQQWDWRNRDNPLTTGLTQITEYFREYFAVSSQGGDQLTVGNYQELPMSLTYLDRHWPTVIPTQFPSYRRSLENFAPEWELTAQVIQAPTDLQESLLTDAVNRLNVVVGYPDPSKNPFSDPLADPKSPASETATSIVNNWRSLLPEFTQGQILDLIWKDVTIPTTVTPTPAPKPTNPSATQTAQTTSTAAAAKPSTVPKARPANRLLEP